MNLNKKIYWTSIIICFSTLILFANELFLFIEPLILIRLYLLGFITGVTWILIVQLDKHSKYKLTLPKEVLKTISLFYNGKDEDEATKPMCITCMENQDTPCEWGDNFPYCWEPKE